ncbi:hypothetical protein K437DRAFT_64692 [Tilletiaria anomala UBC 951]|uniref:WD40 repeat-like protein n=1 Tax=Tilletiaria anomala (strain ATCC 24038 / CBS 436.72 / UBC 951) TaxID=1037660 RepID=A0A066V3B6_TILAU|nr:uncharacterized protein K437DRAFT_64692 [Tilletiaria anomala UBC 951]KDN35916.1 hypothetical protein K437DRAFT_64692 [Tilletiaria anomala UBC 951]
MQRYGMGIPEGKVRYLIIADMSRRVGAIDDSSFRVGTGLTHESYLALPSVSHHIVRVFEIFLDVEQRCSWRLIAQLRTRLGTAKVASDPTAVQVTNEGTVFIGFRNGVVQAWHIAFDSAHGGGGKHTAVLDWQLAGKENLATITKLDVLYNPVACRQELLIAEINGGLSLWDVTEPRERRCIVTASPAAFPRRLLDFEGHQNEYSFTLPLITHAHLRLMAALGADGRLRIWSLDRSRPLNDDPELVSDTTHGDRSHLRDPQKRRGMEKEDSDGKELQVGKYLNQCDAPKRLCTLCWVPRDATSDAKGAYIEDLPALAIVIPSRCVVYIAE